jgi:hypothetical protein
MSTFYRLPVELLTIIAECAIEENHPDGDCMALPLRLTHPLFGRMDCLKAHIFSKVNFHTTREGLEWVQTRLPSGIKPFVKQITFLPSPYSISMSFFHFRQIIIQQWAEGKINSHMSTERSSRTIGRKSPCSRHPRCLQDFRNTTARLLLRRLC